MTWTYRHRKQLIITSSFILLSVLLCFFLYQRSYHQKTSKPEKKIALTKKQVTVEKDKQEVVYYQVDIKGEVNTPGIYSVQQGSRVIDVIRLAGDLTAQADTSVINLSKKVVDEMVIVIYSQEEVKNFTETKEQEKVEQEKCFQATSDSIQNDACITTDELTTNSKISINHATKEELMTLQGIGEAKAIAIIAYREDHGQFLNIEEIKNVAGIGEELFAKIKENITI